MQTFQRKAVLKGHQGSILSLALTPDYSLLFSVGGDAIVKVWDAVKLTCRSVIYSAFDIGDIFSVVYSSSLNQIFLGSQNTNIQWFNLNNRTRKRAVSHGSNRRFNQFFDSAVQRGEDIDESHDPLGDNELDVPFYEIEHDHQLRFAHYGYVYCLLLAYLPQSKNEVLLSGGGDGAIKVWSITDSINLLRELKREEDSEAVTSLVLHESMLYVGCLHGRVDIWDVEVFQHLRSVNAHNADILSMSRLGNHIYTTSATGWISKWDNRFRCVQRWQGHDGIVLASTVVNRGGTLHLATGANDQTLAIWDADKPTTATPISDLDVLQRSLQKLVSIPTISGSQEAESCRRGARFLKNLLIECGATAKLVPTRENRNPLVIGTFAASTKSAKTILYYGHYDIVPPGEGWDTNPYGMDGRDGFLYGRGVSDNKGPVLAAIFAAAELSNSGNLPVRLVFVIEGEEESGSVGFAEAMESQKEHVGTVDWIFLSNSYWLDDEIPCLTYGFRGVVNVTVEVSSSHPNLHSGMDGGSIREPMADLVQLLSCLQDAQAQIAIPGFYDAVRPVTAAENKFYESIVQKSKM